MPSITPDLRIVTACGAAAERAGTASPDGAGATSPCLAAPPAGSAGQTVSKPRSRGDSTTGISDACDPRGERPAAGSPAFAGGVGSAPLGLAGARTGGATEADAGGSIATAGSNGGSGRGPSAADPGATGAVAGSTLSPGPALVGVV